MRSPLRIDRCRCALKTQMQKNGALFIMMHMHTTSVQISVIGSIIISNEMVAAANATIFPLKPLFFDMIPILSCWG
jgi:hypothetical protein